MNNLSSLPGYKIFEYLLVITPHEDLKEKISAMRKEFAEAYENDSTLYAKTHISMVTFSQNALMEERLIQKLNMTASALAPVTIELRDFGSFPSHTIYINVVSKLPFQYLVKTIRTDMQRIMKPDNDHKPHFLTEPFISIGRKLLPWQYEKAWLEYSHKNFTARFIATGMTLMKRPLGEMKYSTVQQFDFKNISVQDTQGSLFL